jgi:type I restriction enzyme M protein
MAMRKTKSRRENTGRVEAPSISEAVEEGGSEEGADEEVVPQGKLRCALTNALVDDTAEEQTLQSFIDQLEREYRVDPQDMARDFEVMATLVAGDTERRRKRKVTLAVFERGKPHTIDHLIRAVLIARAGTKVPANLAESDKLFEPLRDVLASVPDTHPHVYGLWTNGEVMEFLERTYTGELSFQTLTDFPAPDERREDLDNANRRPLRNATKDSLVRTFKRCHDYLYGNKSMDSKKAFWQLLQLIFCKIHDERQSTRLFFVGASEAHTAEGQGRVRQRINTLFDLTKRSFADVLDASDRVDLTDRALAFIVGQIGRYNLLGTDADAKGLAYESITSTTLKRERGQFFTPRNVIEMMVRMMDPKPGQRVLDPACGSGGFLVVALNHVRRALLTKVTAHPTDPVGRELKLIEKELREYASSCLFGIDVDADLRKAARMNMVMNNDGHGHIATFNSWEFGVAGTENSADRNDFTRYAEGGLGKFDLVFTNPPFGAKIPVDNPNVLQDYDLGHQWRRDARGEWVKGLPLKKVAPEIIFIECCYRFLKPGTGRMALVLPDGILGNPGEQMEGVRAWMLREMELLASIDLPAETFLPQVSVQASCVFLRRRYDSEKPLSGSEAPNQGPVFMAIAEKVGHGRRGENLYLREPDGTERFETREFVRRWEREDGTVEERKSSRAVKVLADDLPWIADEYLRGIQAGKGVGA